MEKDWVIHYKDLCEEILDLSRPVKDTVQGSDPEFPWGPRVVSVSGRTPGELERLGELRRRKKEVEDFVAALPWPKRKLARAVMEYGAKWSLVQWELHSTKSPDSLRVEFDRIF